MPDGSKLYIAGFDKTGYLSPNYQYTWSNTMGQIGTASIPLEVSPGDSFAPNVGDEILIQEINRNTSVAKGVFAGLIQRVQINWNTGNNGQHQLTLTCQSLEATVAAAQTPQSEYTDTNAGAIFTGIFTAIAAQLPFAITLGTVATGVSISDRKYSGQSSALSDLNQLATDSGLICFIDPSDFTINLCAASAKPAPFTVVNGMMVRDTIQWGQSSEDFRDRQSIQLAPGLVPPEVAVLAGDGSTTDFTLPKPAMEVVSASVVTGTTGVHGTAIGTFTGQPAAGDTITIAGQVYTFVTPAVDNTQFGQVLIGATSADSTQNLVDAINAASGAGTRYSLPTWTNPEATADSPSGLSFVLRSKTLGTAGNDVALSSSSSHFSWSAGSLGGGQDLGGVALRVGPLSSGNYDVGYTPWSSSITLQLPPKAGTTLVVTYKAVGGNMITVGNGAGATLGVPSQYQIMSTPAAKSLEAALATVSAVLARYSKLPAELQFDTDVPGIAMGHYVPVDISVPLEAAGVLNGNWICKSVTATGWPGAKWWQLPEPYGHFRYTVQLVNSTAISVYQDTLNQLLNSQAAELANMLNKPTLDPSSPAGTGSFATSVASAQRTLTLQDLTVGDDIAPHVCVMTAPRALSSPPLHVVLAGNRILAVLRKTISADLTVRINKITNSSPPTSVSWTVTIPSGTPVDSPLEYAIFGGFADADILTADVLASDGSQDNNGIVTFSVEWV